MNNIYTELKKKGIIPVIKLNDAKDALLLGRALIEGDLPVAEITFRTEAAEKSISIFAEEFPEILTGAGTVLTIEQVRRAVDAGAKFIVAPGFNPKVVDYCLQRDIPVVPGVNSPTQIEMALDRGLEVVKFFPAELSGGLKMIKALSAPYGDIHFIPTGGITAENLSSYIEFDKIIACGGSWMVKPDLIESENFQEISIRCKQAVEIIENARKKTN